jgi:surfeit locus 1 family protein
LPQELLQTKQQWFSTLLWFCFTIAVLAGLINLSMWQYDRGQQKEQRLARIEQLSLQAPLSLPKLVSLANTENLNDYPVVINGTFDNEVLFLLDNQVEKSVLGYRILQLIRTPKHAVLVNLGWIKGSINRSEIPNITPLTGHHKFTGHVRLVETGIMLQAQDLTQASWPLRVQQIELNKFSTLLKESLLPFVVYVNVDEKLGYKKNWQPVVMPPAKHFGYSVQWAALALAWLILMLWLKFSSYYNKNSPKKDHHQNNKEVISRD